MKRLLTLLVFAVFFTGCGSENKELNSVLQLRTQLQQSNGCSFHTKITADYKEALYEFQMDCQVDEQGGMSFSVTAPETIQGITGTVAASGGSLTFDDQVLAFETLADDLITPVSAPWLLVRTLRSGYITAAGTDDTQIHTVINDSYEEQALQVDVWLDEENLPEQCEILWQGVRILSLEVENFVIM